jgi:predicted dehydrogenase
MAMAHAAVLRRMGREAIAIGRGRDSAVQFAKATGLAVMEGGLAARLESSQERPKAAIVAVAIDGLAGAAIALIRHGVKRILVEKPGGLDASQIAAVAQCATDAGAEVFIAYNRRFYPSVNRAQQIISADGGVTSFAFEFTELAQQIARSAHPAAVKANWFLANSSHVVNLAFFLGGRPRTMSAMTSGSTGWHSPAKFAGCGATSCGTLFHYGADWTSAGRWGVAINTPKRRLFLRPLESLQVQDSGQFNVETLPVDDDAERDLKPGLLGQMRAFLDGMGTAALLDVGTHLDMVKREYTTILRGGELQGT